MKKIKRDERLEDMIDKKKAKTVALRHNNKPKYDPKPIEIPNIETKKKQQPKPPAKKVQPQRLEFADAPPLP
jgi:hypothetical protein